MEVVGGALNGLGPYASFAALKPSGKVPIVIPLVYLYPLVTILLAILFLREKLTRVQIAGIILAIILGIFLALRWQAERRRRAKADQNIDLFNMGDLLKNLGDALLKRAQDAAEALASRFKLDRATRLLQAARIRWVYYQLMDLCMGLGHPRRAAVTPVEFLPDLVGLFPDSQQGLEFITQAYLKVRYGELPESTEEVEGVISAWKEIETLGKQQKAALKKAR